MNLDKGKINFMSQNDRKFELRKVFTILVGLVLLISGLVITTMPVGAGGEVPTARGARAIENDTSANHFPPDVDPTNMSTAIIINDANAFIILNVTVYDADENNLTSWAGTNITNVKVDLTAFGTGVGDMDYNISASENGSYNVSRMEGFYEHNLSSLPGVTAGDYLIWFNATDSGLNGTGATPGPNSLYNNMVNFTIMIGQENRPPDVRTVGEGGDFSHDFDEDANLAGNPYTFNLNDTVFIDPEIVYQTSQNVSNYPNTAADDLTFTFWDGTAWTASSTDFGVFSVSITGAVASVTGDADMNTTTTGETVTFNVTDSYGEWETKDVTIIINAVNDAPMIVKMDTNNETSATVSVDGFMITINQGDMANLTVNASDEEMDALTYTLNNYNITNTSLTQTVFDAEFLLDAATGDILFIPTNDWVGTFEINVSVEDADEVWKNFTFEIMNMNDDPIITTAGTVSVVDHAAALTGTAGATEDAEFVFTVEADDIDLGIASAAEALTFAVTSGDVSVSGMAYGTTMYNVSFTPDNDNAMMGYVMVNVSVKDDTGIPADDYVVVTIDVANAPDAPEIKWVDVFAPPTNNSEPIDMSGTVITAGESMNVTIKTEDMDGDTLYIESNLTALTTFTPIVNETNNWTMTFSPTDDEVGTVYLKVTVSDAIFAGLEDFVVLKFEVETGDLPNNAPTMTVNTTSGQKIMLGGILYINGTWADEDGDDVDILVSMKMPGDANFSTFDSGYDMTVNDDGTWSLSYDTSLEKSYYDAVVAALQMAKDLGLSGDDLKAAEDAITESLAYYTGTWSFKFMADDDDLQSAASSVITVTVEGDDVTPPDDDDDDDDDDAPPMSMGLFAYDILIIIILIVVILLVVLMMMKKKKKPEEEPAPEEGMAPAPEAGVEGAAAEATCTTCGGTIAAGSPTCPACGAPAPPPAAPPEEQPPEPPLGVTCATCGGAIPDGSPTCPACGAPAPPPAAPPEMPPEEAPPPIDGEMMAAPPAEAPPEGMPAEAPPPEMPPAEAPPEGMPPAEMPPAEAPPPEMPPAEAPPPEMPPAAAPPPAAPPEQAAAPPPGMAACPQCGGQIQVGAPNCPSCGTPLSW